MSLWSSQNPLALQLKQLAQVASVLGGGVSSDAQKRQPAGGWHCKRSNCLFAQKGYANYAERTHCHGCYWPKAKAQNPPQSDKIAREDAKAKRKGQNDEPKTKDEDKKEEKKQRARARKQEARLAFKAAKSPSPACTVADIPEHTPGPVAAAMAQAEAPVQPIVRLKLSEELIEKIPHLVPHVLKFCADSLQQETVPTTADPKTPESQVARFIGERGPTAKAAKKFEHEETIKRLKVSAMALVEAGEPAAELLAGVQAKIESLELAVAKLAKDAPTQDHERKAVAEARASYEVAIQSRLDREAQGASKAADRQAARDNYIAELKAQVLLLEVGSNEVVKENEVKHQARAAAAAELDKKVLALFDRKLASLSEVPESDQAQPNVAQLPNAGAVAGGSPTSALALTNEPGAASLQEKDAQIAALTAALEQFRAAAIRVNDFERAVTINANDLPKAFIPPDEDLQVCGALLNVLQLWKEANEVEIFTWQGLATYATNVGGPIAVAKCLLGPCWQSWYDSDPDLTSTVPRRLALQMWECLSKIKLEFDAEILAKLKAEAAEGYLEIQKASKRLRHQ